MKNPFTLENNIPVSGRRRTATMLIPTANINVRIIRVRITCFWFALNIVFFTPLHLGFLT
jgi:hypothetical protein